MKLGYIRVSRDKQTTALQEDAMRREQCERTFTDKMTGKRFDRPEFLRMLDLARAGDVIVVWRLDRLGRSLKDLIETVQALEQRGIELKSLKENGETGRSNKLADVKAALEQVTGVTHVGLADTRGGVVGLEIASESGRDIRRDLAAAVVTRGWGLLELRPMRMSLEEVFLQVTTEEPPPELPPAPGGPAPSEDEARVGEAPRA